MAYTIRELSESDNDNELKALRAENKALKAKVEADRVIEEKLRDNEVAAKRVHDLNKRQKSNSAAPTDARIQRAFGNLTARKLVQASSKDGPHSFQENLSYEVVSMQQCTLKDLCGDISHKS